MAALNRQKQGDHSYGNRRHRQSNVLNGLTHNSRQRQSEFDGSIALMDPWYWLIHLGVS